MSILNDVLYEEYERKNRIKDLINDEIAELPQGYVSVKKIKGNEYNYLQKREGKKIVSKYIKADNVEEIRELINRRKELLSSLKEIEKEIKEIGKILNEWL